MRTGAISFSEPHVASRHPLSESNETGRTSFHSFVLNDALKNQFQCSSNTALKALINIYVDDKTYHSFPHFIGKSAWYRSLAHFVGKAAWDLSFSKPDKATLGSHSSVELVLVVHLDQKIFYLHNFYTKELHQQHSLRHHGQRSNLCA